MNRREPMPSRRIRSVFATLLTLASLTAAGSGRTETLNTMVFQGVQNWPLFAAEQKGFFAKRDLTINQKIAPNSQELRDGLKEGRYQIVHTSVDNAVAMAEQAGIDIAVVLGGDNGWND